MNIFFVRVCAEHIPRVGTARPRRAETCPRVQLGLAERDRPSKQNVAVFARLSIRHRVYRPACVVFTVL